MAKGYVILTEDIVDADKLTEYGRASGPSLMEHHGRPLVVDEQVEVLEGQWHGTRTVIVEFESVAAAHAWYDSDSYRAALPLRQAGANCNVVIVAGFEMRAPTA